MYATKIELEIINEYSLHKNAKLTAEKFNIDRRRVKRILLQNNIEINKRQQKFKHGDIIGEMKVLSAWYKDRFQWIRCECLHKNCGNLTTIKVSELVKKGRKFFCCYECTKEQLIPVRYHKGIHMTYWKRIEKGARSRNLPLEITVDDAWKLFEKQNGVCVLSGLEINLDMISQKKHNNTASLDRIDSTKGYIEGNIQWIYIDLNSMKWNLNTDYFIELCNKVHAFNGKFEQRDIIIQFALRKDSTGYKNISGLYFYQLSKNAKARNIEFNLDIQDIWDVYISQHGRCKFTGNPVEFIRIQKNQHLKTASVDRIDSSKGYSKDNIQIVHKDINKIKGKLTDEKFRYYCEKISDYQLSIIK